MADSPQNNQNTVRPVYILYPTLYSLLMFNYLVERAGVSFSGVVLSTAHIKRWAISFSLLESFYILIKKCGLYYALYMFLNIKCAYIFITFWKITAALQGKTLKLKTFGHIIRKNRIPAYKTKNINGDGCVDFIKRVNANLIVSSYNNQILRYSLCKKIPFGAISAHNSYLPDFGGLDAAFESLYQGVSESGATVYVVDKGIDTGDIISQKKFSVEKNATALSLNFRQWLLCAELLPDVIKQFESGHVNAVKQDRSKLKYTYKSFPERGRVKSFLHYKKRFVRLKEVFVPPAYVCHLFMENKGGDTA